VLTIIAMAVAVGAVVSLVGISRGFEDSFLDLYRSAGIDVVVVRAGVQERINSTLDAKLAKDIEKVPGVRLAVPSLMDMISFEDQGLYTVPIRAAPPGAPVFDHLKMIEGRQMRAGDERVAVLGKTLAEQLHKHVDDVIKLYDVEDYKVIGIFDADSLFDNASLSIPLADLQRIMGRPNQVNGFTVDVKAIDELKDARGKPLKLTALSAKDHVQSITQIRMAHAMSWLTSVIALVIGTVGVLNTMFMSVFERTREIGVLRAIGWKKHRVVRMILSESLAMSLAGAVVGAFGAAHQATERPANDARADCRPHLLGGHRPGHFAGRAGRNRGRGLSGVPRRPDRADRSPAA
jgi:putative ABC transport system permease protein